MTRKSAVVDRALAAARLGAQVELFRAKVREGTMVRVRINNFLGGYVTDEDGEHLARELAKLQKEGILRKASASMAELTESGGMLTPEQSKRFMNILLDESILHGDHHDNEGDVAVPGARVRRMTAADEDKLAGKIKGHRIDHVVMDDLGPDFFKGKK